MEADALNNTSSLETISLQILLFSLERKRLKLKVGKGILLDLVSRVSRGRRRSAIMFDIGSARLLRIMSYAVWVSASTHFPLWQWELSYEKAWLRMTKQKSSRTQGKASNSWLQVLRVDGRNGGDSNFFTFVPLSPCMGRTTILTVFRTRNISNVILIIIPKHGAQWDVYCLFVINEM